MSKSAWDKLPVNASQVNSYMKEKDKKTKEEKTSSTVPAKPQQSKTTAGTGWSSLPTSLNEIEQRKNSEKLELDRKFGSIMPTATKNADAQYAGYYNALEQYGQFWGDRRAELDAKKNREKYMSNLKAQYDSHAAHHQQQNKGFFDRFADKIRDMDYSMNGIEGQMQREEDRYNKDTALYNRMARDAATAGSRNLYDRAVQGDTQARDRYVQTLQKLSGDYSKAYERERPGQYYADTMSKADIEAQIRHLEHRGRGGKIEDRIDTVNQNHSGTGGKFGETGDDTSTLTETKKQERKAALEQALKIKEAQEKSAKYKEAVDALTVNGQLTDEAKSLAKRGREQEEMDRDFSFARGISGEDPASYVLQNAIDLKKPMEKTYAERDAADGYITDEERDIYYAIYARDPVAAKEWLAIAQERADSEYYGGISEYWGQGLRRIPGLAVAAGASLLSGLDPTSDFGQHLSKTAQSITVGGAKAIQEKGLLNTGFLAGQIDDDVPIIGGKGLGDLYQLAESMVQSGAIAAASAAAGRYDAALGQAASFVGTMLMGGSAAAADYRESLERGMTKDQAERHAMAAGVAEAAFEHISLDNLLSTDISKGFWKNVLKQGGIEASEELCTTLANRISDGILARSEGYDTSIEQRTKELIALGLNTKEANSKAEQEWIVDLINDGLGGFLSGGIMSTGNTLANWNEYKRAMAESGAMISQANEASAIRAFAEDNGIDIDSDMVQRGIDAIEAEETAEQHADAAENETQQNKQSIKELVQEKVSARKEQRSNRALGEAASKTVNKIQEQIHESGGLQSAQAVYSETVKKYGEGISRAAQEAVAIEATAVFADAKNQAELNGLYQEAKDTISGKALARTVERAYDAATRRLATIGDTKARERIVQQYHSTSGKLNTEIVVKGKDGTESIAKIADITKNGDHVLLDNGQTVRLEDVESVNADTKDLLEKIQYMELGDAAVDLWHQFQAGAESRTAEENYRYIMDWSQAFDQGRVGDITVEDAISRSSLDAKTVRDAYALGQIEKRGMEQRQENQKRERLAKKRQEAKQGFTGRKGVLDDTRVSDKDLRDAKRRDKTLEGQIQGASLIAEALGVNITLYNSFDDATWHGTENGSYNPVTNTIMLDINAGKTAAQDFKSGLLAVCGHELTHWMQEYAHDAYVAYRDAVVGYISESQGRDNLNNLILEQQSRNSSLSRDEAIDEIVADASMDRMGDKAFWEAISEGLGEKRADVRSRVLQYIKAFFAKIREALGTKQQFYSRDAIRALEQQMQDALSALYAEGIRAATQTAQETIMKEANILGASSQILEDAVTKKSSRLSKETIDFLENQEHVKVYRAMQLIDGKLYPPMAAKVEGKFVDPTEIGEWYQSIERPDLVKNGKFTLNKGNGSSIVAAYNPYFHCSASPLNDQFSSAYKRPNLVVVEGVIPSSELTSGYKAEGAKNAVGETTWHAGPVASKLKGDKARRVYLSRYFKVTRIMTDEEVAGIVAKTLDGESVSVPSNVVTPGLLEALRIEGVPIDDKRPKQQGGKNTATEGGDVQYSVRPDIDTDLQNIKERNFNFNTELLIGTTSDFLVNEIGFKPLTNYMSAKKAYRAMVTKEQAIKDGQPTGTDIHYHNLGVNGLHRILEKSETPVVAYVSATDDFDGRRTRLVLVTDYTINNGTGVTVVEPDLKATPERGRIRANKEITVFSKENIKKAVIRAAKENRLLYLDKNRGSIFNSGEPGTNNPVAISEDVLKDNIAKFWADVKWRDYKNTGIGSAGDNVPNTPFAEALKNWNQKSTRDTSLPSDLELALDAATEIVDGGGDGYWASLLESDPGIENSAAEIKTLGERLKKTEKALAAAKEDLKLTDRKLKTRGIASLAATIMQDQKAGDINKKDVKKRITDVLTNAYQQALDALDNGADVGTAWETVFENGVVPAADILLDDATYAEKHGYGWAKTTLGAYYGEGGRDAVIGDISARVAQDFDANRYRPGRRATAADRIAERFEKKVQAAKAETASLRAENQTLNEAKAFYAEQARIAKERSGELYQDLLDKREELKQSKQLNEKERRAQLRKLDNMNKQLQAKRREAKVWEEKAKIGWKFANEAIRQKDAAVEKLEQQLQREKDILSGKLRPVEIQRMLKAARDREAAKIKQQKDEVFARYKERKSETELRGKIRNLSSEMKRRMTRPTDGAYVPASLYGAMTHLADVMDTLLAPKEGTTAAARHHGIMDAIHGLAREYSALESSDDYSYKSEFDADIMDEIAELERTLAKSDGHRLSEYKLDDLREIYEILRSVNQTMVTATKMLSKSNFKSIFEAMDSVVKQQKEMNSFNKLSWYGKKRRLRMLDSMSTMRAVEMMSDWNRDAALYRLMHNVENGVDKSNAWAMEYNKAMQDLKTGKNEKEYRDALTKKLDYHVQDDMGDHVLMTKMQALQILMTAEREAKNDKLQHLHRGGATIRDAVAIQDGKIDKATAQNIRITPQLISRIQSSLTSWDRAYMKAIREYFAREGKETNRVMYELKHRVLQTEEAYFPYIVDKNYLDTNLGEEQAMNMWVKAPGSTNALAKKASQPVIIDGVDTVMARHVREIADYIGLAIPIRDFSKVYNGRLKQGEGENQLPVKQTIDRNFGKKGQHLLTQSIIDVQGGSRSASWSTAISENLNKLQGAFVRSALLINPSVTIKQAASYVAAASVLSQQALDRANHPISVKTDASYAFDPATGLIGHIFFAPNGKTATRIYDEIDRHTSLHYMRRQGMSQYEIASEANRSGAVRRKMGEIGASLEQTAAGHAARKVAASMNPVNWIQRMDVATTATIWLACKEQSRMDGFRVNSEEYWNRTTELYERAIRETQPMYDSLHRNAGQKSRDGSLVQYLFPFRTVPIQNHGQIAASYETLKAAMRSKDEKRIKEAKKFFAKTMVAQTESAIIFSLMTFLAAALKRKTRKYRNDEEEMTIGSILEGIGTDAAGTMFSNIFPLFGSSVWDSAGNIYDSVKTGKKVWSYDSYSIGVVDMMNEFIKSAENLATDGINALAGNNLEWDTVKGHMGEAVVKSLKMLGIPAQTIVTYAEGIMKNIEDIKEGRDSWERTAALNSTRYLNAWNAGDKEKMQAVKEEMLQNYKKGGKDDPAANEYLKKKLTETAKASLLDNASEDDDIISFLVGTGFYDEDEAWKKVMEWRNKEEHAGEEDYSYSQYEDFLDALDNGASFADAGADYLAHGYTEEKLVNAAKGRAKERYMAGEISDDKAINLLIEYGMDEDDAWKKVQEWKGKAAHAGDEDYSYSQYDFIDEAVAANKDIHELVNDLATHGVKMDDITSHIKSLLVDRYVNGDITENALKNQLSRYCKIVAKNDVDKILRNANCKKQFGVPYSELDEAYRAGGITSQAMKSALVRYGGLSTEDANKKVRWYDLQKQNPSMDIKESIANSWYDGSAKSRENGRESAKAAGMSIESYIKAKTVLENVKGYDNNGDGKADNYSREKMYIKALDGMNITAAQKWALYYEEYKGANWRYVAMPSW